MTSFAGVLQALLTTAIVAGAATYALWTLMPASGRRAIASAASRLPGLRQVSAVQRAVRASDSGCSSGCADCAGSRPQSRPGTRQDRGAALPETINGRRVIRLTPEQPG